MTFTLIRFRPGDGPEAYMADDGLMYVQAREKAEFMIVTVCAMQAAGWQLERQRLVYWSL